VAGGWSWRSSAPPSPWSGSPTTTRSRADEGTAGLAVGHGRA
jgi:hypothetical protein